ncbi:MAG: radical SAM protein [Nitrospinaceae bacterium]|nr:radical SAM protein [Nitrospinaceae bacterium]NIR53374.1 radical SAM protein [Nitrospinaceae bacterium]NIS83778.1 radical SAM protein [Nitrospinaceae bacterium]NIT80577.1 radical SAM protein [Nitrospinaceae bacterium]NIU42898.1 radical SAM protein [Nitrospinaceae bacterium]
MTDSVPSFQINAEDFEPAYMKLFRTGELYRRSREALRELADCKVCPRDCGVDRLNDEWALCKTGRYAWVSSHFPHFGEEDGLRGWNGSGTIFFSMCNLKCVFCQNFDISQSRDGMEARPEMLAQMMLELQAKGCHNINFVTPEHVVPQILEALPLAVQMGLRLPLVYNTGAYDSLASIRMMDGIVDIYMPDFKYWDEWLSAKYLKAKNYPQAARAVIREMQRQVGDLVFDEQGLAKRGVLVRHLVMPDNAEDSRKIMRFLAREVSPHTYINIMDQYRPAGKVTESRYREIHRRTSPLEHEAALRIAREEGLYRFDTRNPSAFLAFTQP